MWNVREARHRKRLGLVSYQFDGSKLHDSRIARYLAEAQPARGSARTTGGDGVSEPFSAIVAIAGRGPQTLDEGERDIVLALTG
jgi:hypothetical protein